MAGTGRRGLGVAVLTAAAAAAAWQPGPALGQSANGAAAITPAGEHDPGAMITVSNASGSPGDLCSSTQPRVVSVDVLSNEDRLISGPHLERITGVDGRWSVEVPLAPTLPPGGYKAVAVCETDDENRSRVRSYDPAPFTVRVQSPGQPAVRPGRAEPGDEVRISSGAAHCAPPKGSPGPRVRASILDEAGVTRGEGETDVQRDGSWTVTLRVPDIPPTSGSVTAACQASVSASAPYARYGRTPFTVTEPPPPSTTATTPTTVPPLAPGETVPPPTQPAPTTTRGPAPRIAGFGTPLPPTPVAQAIVAEPTYTG